MQQRTTRETVLFGYDFPSCFALCYTIVELVIVRVDNYIIINVIDQWTGNFVAVFVVVWNNLVAILVAIRCDNCLSHFLVIAKQNATVTKLLTRIDSLCKPPVHLSIRPFVFNALKKVNTAFVRILFTKVKLQSVCRQWTDVCAMNELLERRCLCHVVHA